MKLSILTENVAQSNFEAEHGLSYFIEYDDKKILFDTGQSDMFLKNAKKLNINLENIDFVVLSHGHYDHGDGLKYLNNKKLICHNDVFIKRYRKHDNSYLGLALTFEELSQKFEIIKTKKPYKITENIIFLGEIPGSPYITVLLC